MLESRKVSGWILLKCEMIVMPNWLSPSWLYLPSRWISGPVAFLNQMPMDMWPCLCQSTSWAIPVHWTHKMHNKKDAGPVQVIESSRSKFQISFFSMSWRLLRNYLHCLVSVSSLPMGSFFSIGFSNRFSPTTCSVQVSRMRLQKWRMENKRNKSQGQRSRGWINLDCITGFVFAVLFMCFFPWKGGVGAGGVSFLLRTGIT